VFTLAAVLALFGMIYARISLDRSAFELAKLETRISQEQARYWDLRVERARLLDPIRVSQAAERLGMVFPDERIPIEVDGVTPRVEPGVVGGVDGNGPVAGDRP